MLLLRLILILSVLLFVAAFGLAAFTFPVLLVPAALQAVRKLRRAAPDLWDHGKARFARIQELEREDMLDE
jgi:hypothetical protein